jgi:tellurite methyltransferase
MNQTLHFFSQQFQRQIASQDYELNPFERLALPYVRGSVLDLGCGLGNFSLAAARLGHRVLAIDACGNAVADLRRRAAMERLPMQVEQRNLSDWTAGADRYDTVVAIGLLMFFPPEQAVRAVTEIQQATLPGGRAIVNVLTDGTTFMDMFEPGGHFLFSPAELLQWFDGWNILEHRIDEFAAGASKAKRFSTLVAERREGARA